MSTCYQRLYQGTSHYLRRGCSIHLFVVRPQRLRAFWRNRSPEFSLHWSLSSCVHIMTSLHSGHVIICREHDVHASLLHIYIYIGIACEKTEWLPCAAIVIFKYRLWSTGARTKTWSTLSHSWLHVPWDWWPYTYISVCNNNILAVTLLHGAAIGNILQFQSLPTLRFLQNCPTSLSSSCFFLKVVQSVWHGPPEGMPLLVCFHHWWPLDILTDTSTGVKKAVHHLQGIL
jgi:hypothetical protein